MTIWKRIQRWFLGPQVESIDVERNRFLPVWQKYKLTIHWDNGEKWDVRGDCTVWHRYPTGTRLSSTLEAMCYNAVVVFRWMEENT